MTAAEQSGPEVAVCPGCLGRRPAARMWCLACHQALPDGMRAALARTDGRPLADRDRAIVVAETLTWMRVRREGRHG